MLLWWQKHILIWSLIHLNTTNKLFFLCIFEQSFKSLCILQELVVSSLQTRLNLILHTSACFILMLACDGGTQRGSSHISNELGTMWLRTINIPQCQGHCGGICLLEPLPIPPPPPFFFPSILLSPFLPPHLAEMDFVVMRLTAWWETVWTSASRHTLLWLFPSLKSKWEAIAEYLWTFEKRFQIFKQKGQGQSVTYWQVLMSAKYIYVCPN